MQSAIQNSITSKVINPTSTAPDKTISDKQLKLVNPETTKENNLERLLASCCDCV